jgi:tetratricopeptide (TPR) repeat protein
VEYRVGEVPVPAGRDEAVQAARQAMSAVAVADWPAAARLFAAARAGFAAVGDTSSMVRVTIGLANTLSEQHMLSDALDLLEQLEARADVDEALLTTVLANKAVCLGKGGGYDQAAHLFQICFGRFLDQDEPVEAAMCMHNAAKTLHDRGREHEALHAVSAAREILAQLGDEPEHLVAHCDSTAGTILLQLGESAAAIAAERVAVERFERLGRSLEVARSRGNLAIAALDLDDLEGAEEHLDRAEPEFRRAGDRSALAAVDTVRVRIALAAGSPRKALRAAVRAVRAYGELESVLDYADALHNLAVVCRPLGRTTFALRAAQAAFTLVDDYRYGLLALRDRHLVTIGRFEPLLLNVLDLAQLAGSPAEVAELVERARVGSRPSSRATGEEIIGGLGALSPPRPVGDGLFSDDVRLPLEPRRPVIIAPLPGQVTSSKDRTGRPILLPDVVRATGGDGAWWWGTWVQRGALHWAVRASSGRLLSGRTDISADVLDLIHSLVPVPTDAERELAAENADSAEQAGFWVKLLVARRLAAGPMLHDPGRADDLDRLLPSTLRRTAATPITSLAEVAERLGDALLPSPLADAMRAEPVRVVASLAPGLAWAPLPLLGIPGTGGRLLGETSVISLLPPLPIADDLVATVRDGGTLAPSHVSVSVVDPLDDLPHAARGRFGTARELAGIGSSVTPRAVATKANLACALAEAPRSSLFLYQGHVDTTDPGEPLTAAMLLTGPDGRADPLSAREILTDRGTWTFPNDVLLDGCESLGAQGSVEWGTLVPALLSTGAARVTATMWPLLDDAQTAELTTEIASLLLSPGDAAWHLAALQRRHLDAWVTGTGRIAPHYFAAHIVTGLSTLPSPARS